jgi:hypothetical protein
LRSPFTSLTVCASGSSGENPSFDLGRSGRRRRHRHFPLGGVAFGGLTFRLLVLACVALHLLRRLGVCAALGRCGGRSGGFGLFLRFVGVDFGRLGDKVVGLAGTRSWDRCVCVAEVWMSERRLRERLLLSVVSCCLGA